MTALAARLFVLFMVVCILLAGCARSEKFIRNQEEGIDIRHGIGTEKNRQDGDDNFTAENNTEEGQATEKGSDSPQGSTNAESAKITENQESKQSSEHTIDVHEIKPNEAGKIMVVMFHNFIETYESGDKEFTTTFDEFKKLLASLYDAGYRLISLSDYLNNHISVPAGCIPMVFTFDDGTPGQFHFIEENGKLVVSQKTAVGILEEFNKIYPDFGLKGTFFVNLGLGTFQGKGTLAERLKYLIDMGFEIGNHTLNHAYLSKIKTIEEIQKEIGGNQKKMHELVPGYMMNSLSLPYGGYPSKELQDYLSKGEYEGVKYENLAILEVGWDPVPSPVNKDFNPMALHRVRASGIDPVDTDLGWWLKRLSRDEQYVSDGNPDIITVPREKEKHVDKEKLNGKQLIIY